MKNILCLFFLAGALATQAQTSNELFRHVPADADHVYHIRLDAIGAKTPWPTIAALLKDHNLGSHHPLSGMDIASFMNSGIDFSQDIVVAESNAFAPDSPRYFTFITHLTDSGKLAAFVREKAKGAHGEAIRYIHVGKDRIAIHDHDAAAWTEHLAVLLVYMSPTTPANSATPTPLATHQARLARRCVAALHGLENPKFLSDPRVATAFADDADVHIWNRHTGNMSNLGKMFGGKAGNMAGLAGMMQKASTDASISTLSFQPGKIVFRNQRLITPAEKSGLQRVVGQDGLSHELVAAIPPGEVMGMVTVHLDMAAWTDSIGKTPMAGMFTGQLQEKGLSLQDFPKALKGDFLILAYAPDKNAPSAKAMPSIYLLAAVKDKEAFTRIAKTLKFSDATAPEEIDTTTTDSTLHKKKQMYYGLQGNLAVLTGSRQQAAAFFNHPAATSNPAARLLTPEAYTNSFTMGIDMQAVGDFLKPMLTKEDTISSKDKGLLDAIHAMDLVEMSTGAIHDDVAATTVELRMTDTNKNALAGFVEILAGLSKNSHGGAEAQ